MFKVKLLMILQSKCLCQDVFQWLNLCVSISLCVCYLPKGYIPQREKNYLL